ncbi:MAG: 3-phosphoshikimate 1-carboxyvinyltransferase [Methanofollis sp.]|uniref:3-phosphoshikimate 1-carboxyvinyltransferase n=1 Tax=Methanofollis sp. TaxID=2052835 RepID=UPI00261458A6|nr:3-phosphoshikimate 1-carboxyvinyltransferase [Methanofollis sp.]MDD4254739.1 3-phosphoshikimate 1-carboxyvinyltransferase [Methanofollis sp.]
MEVTLSRRRGVDVTVTAPPSKSLTHRALVTAALAEGESRILGPLRSGDTARTREGLAALGVGTTDDGDDVLVRGCGGVLPLEGPVTVDAGDSGTSLRFLAGLATLSPWPVTLTGSLRMQERPVGPLGDAIAALGGSVAYEKKPGCPPVTVTGPVRGGAAAMRGDVSSQFISALLIAAPCYAEGLDLSLTTPPVSASYLDLTAAVMGAFGVPVERGGEDRFIVRPGLYRGRPYSVEGDWSSASYFFAIAAVCGGRVAVRNLDLSSLQGDRLFLDALVRMGCRVRAAENTVILESDGDLDGITIDMAASPDTVQTLAAVAAFARGPTTIAGISHLRYKESDRVAAVVRVLRGLGSRVAVEEDALTITPTPLWGGVVDPANDHRTAMSAAVIGLGAGNVKILHAECVDKSFPGFWDSLQGAGLL